jgi:hypothetical protein
MHEEQSDQSRFDGGDAERDRGIEAAQVESRGEYGETGANEQRKEYREIHFQGRR